MSSIIRGKIKLSSRGSRTFVCLLTVDQLEWLDKNGGEGGRSQLVREGLDLLIATTERQQRKEDKNES
ncbi:MAG: hypothetical protein ACREVA_00075 [Burkholderiales bacterium]